MDGTLEVICGKRHDRVAAARVRAWSRLYAQTVVELGTGDGRWLYRLARANPRSAFLGLDANADRMREVSFRAARKPARGGVPNLLFVRAAVEALPLGLAGIADEIYVLYPWGSLLEAVWLPRRDALRAIANLAKPGARVEIHVNTSAVFDGDARISTLKSGYASGGIELRTVRVQAAPLHTSWAMRVAYGRDPRVIVLEGTVSGIRSQISDETPAFLRSDT